MFFEALQFSLETTLPTILLMLLGVYLRRRRIVNEAFCTMTSKVIFHFTLPAMIFLNVLKSPLDYGSEINLILTGGIGTLLIYFLAEWWAAKKIPMRQYRCIFTQGAVRTNAVILGLALVLNAYGDKAITSVSIYTAFLVIIFNTLGVITILNSLSDKKPNIWRLCQAILKNPLILAIVFGLICNAYQITFPQPLMKTAQTLGSITLPMALICIGAAIDFKALRQFRAQGQDNELNRVVLSSSLVRLLLAPIFLFILGKWGFGLNPMQLGILFLTSATPVATAAYTMTIAYGGNSTGIANLIGITTIGSIFTASFGLLVLRQLGWI